jgi:predicted ATPase
MPSNSRVPQMPDLPLVGRKKELADVLRLFLRDGVRLVTVTGPEGVGKTRFAREVAAELDGELQLVDDADIAEIPSDTRVLATSRDRLGAPGERIYRLRPLAEAPAVELFRQRATVANPDFDASYADIAAACVRLGRLPGPILQAAARGSLD